MVILVLLALVLCIAFRLWGFIAFMLSVTICVAAWTASTGWGIGISVFFGIIWVWALHIRWTDHQAAEKYAVILEEQQQHARILQRQQEMDLQAEANAAALMRHMRRY